MSPYRSVCRPAARGPLVCSFVVLCLSLALGNPTRASRLIPRTLDELASGSDLIFCGRCESVSSYWNADHTLILTGYRFRVTRGIKGALGGAVTVEELGGTVGSRGMHVSDVPRYSVGEEVLLCVKRTELGRWETFGAGQGRFEIERDRQGRVWVKSNFYARQLEAMAPTGQPNRGAPLEVLAGRLISAAPVRGTR